jgi:hypothetical protein
MERENRLEELQKESRLLDEQIELEKRTLDSIEEELFETKVAAIAAREVLRATRYRVLIRLKDNS